MFTKLNKHAIQPNERGHARFLSLKMWQIVPQIDEFSAKHLQNFEVCVIM